MKKAASLLLALVLTLGLMQLPTPVRAATASSAAGAVTISGGYLNVRSAPSTGAAAVASLRKGSHITLLARSGDWWQVEYAKGKTGYCHADYITPVSGSPAQVTVRSGGLNIRSGPGTGYRKTGTLSKGETVIRLSTSAGWSRVLYHGTQTGYVSAQYLSSGNSPVSLTVPNFKQTDPRWAELTIGQSGKTFAQIGCATTAIAIMESHRTGKTVYPDAMARQLRYTPSGSVYWPSHYTAVTSPDNYLSGIYAQLLQGKPVLLGSRNAGGKQHWVVVSGFTGGDLTPAAFTIRDPGSNSRTNLQQFLDLYPHFYKYFFYS